MATSSQEPGFLSGAVTLSVANLISQGLGLFAKIAILWLLGEEGVGIYNYPYATYAILLSFSSVGFNVAISKLVAEAISRKEYYQGLRVLRASLQLMITLGFVAALLLAALAWPLAQWVHRDPRATLSYLVLAPAALASSWQAAYRGFFQGTQNMRPNAFSQIVEQGVRIAGMLGFAALFLPWGLSWGAAGATLGGLCGAGASYIFLRFLFNRLMATPPWHNLFQGELPDPATLPTAGELYRSIISQAIPISIAGLGFPLFLLADSLMMVNRLQAAGRELTLAVASYGAYANNAMSIIALPTVLSGALFVALVPALSRAKAQGDSLGVLWQSKSALKLAMLLALPAAMGIFLVASPLCASLGMSELTVSALQLLVYGVPFLVLQQVSAGILQGLGYSRAPLITMLCGAAGKGILTWLLTPQWALAGAAWGTNIGFMVAALLNLLLLFKVLGPCLDFDRALLRPALATAAMAGGMLWLQQQLAVTNPLWQMALLVPWGVLLYIAGIAVTDTLTPEDYQLLPGKRLAKS
ncbi:MAG: polysaccharide biosynthesis protein [Symbiobacteriaceae bacterium]|nr:polysaccharide biosynthesis protein [Symbiobacteriaceae bacterium]